MGRTNTSSSTDLFSTFATPLAQYCSTRFCRHSFAKTVSPLSLDTAWLIRAFHSYLLLMESDSCNLQISYCMQSGYVKSRGKIHEIN